MDLDCKDDWFCLMVDRLADHAYAQGLPSANCRAIRWAVSLVEIRSDLGVMIASGHHPRAATATLEKLNEQVGEYSKAMKVLDIVCPV
jgi:hypothetical protein